MFNKKIVFVVGAGGSFELGLPVGETLKGIIAKKLDLPQPGRGVGSGDDVLRKALVYRAKKAGGDINQQMHRHWIAAQAVRSAMPQAISIDNYLHTHASDEDVVTVGKFGIAASILEAEHKSKIYHEHHGRPEIDFTHAPDSWHNTFCKILTENVQLDRLDKIFENVTFITFNYDRCIEHYVLWWLIRYMRLSWEDCTELCQKLKIFHPYGKVCGLPWQRTGMPSSEYGWPAEHEILNHAAGQIRTFTERVDDEKMLADMRGAISECEQLVYLGFSFGMMNMELMNVDGGSNRKRIYATALGMSEPNKALSLKRIVNSVSGVSDVVIEANLLNSTANALMKDYWYEFSY
ncbi:hypothetical protein [Rhizobium sp. Root483D2]|uniref:hypothetical protein n=1 Tax=Rhizobium sp. Root483D2 TaxID=1736545 RepID=UPI0007156CA4|nr:hypothetical protein [Rhizobium sp. Root483D2]KQY48569.1 hypothetical protein ASD32_09245 [Rhizobium sp. Root483D2]